MTSPAKVSANQRNAQASTGPRDAGKVMSSRNALVHGLTARRHQVIEGESQAEFEEFATDIIGALLPGDAIQHALAEDIATCLWRLRRIVDLEAVVLSLARHEASPLQSLAAGFALVRDQRYADAIDLLGRHEQRIEARFSRGLQRLRRLQVERTNPNCPGSLVEGT